MITLKQHAFLKNCCQVLRLFMCVSFGGNHKVSQKVGCMRLEPAGPNTFFYDIRRLIALFSAQ